VRVTYTIYPSGWRPFGGFEYILQTGASWNGTIGRAVVKVHLPYPVTNENVSLSGRSIIGMPLAPQPDGYTIEGSAIRWEFTDLEPGPQDNIFVDVLDPQRYQALVDARSRAAAEPGSADAQVALAKASSGAILVLKAVNPNGGGGELAEQVKAAYRRALELAPDREDILVGYIDWLMRSGGYLSLMYGGECPVEACNLLDRALKLYPNNPDLINWDKNVQSMRADATIQAQYQQTLTAEAETQIATSQPSTPTAMAETYTPTITPADTSTPTARPSATVTPLPTSVSAADEPPDSRAPESQSTQIVLVVLGLVIMIAAGLLFRSGVLARRK
jgi:hypothetical protein